MISNISIWLAKEMIYGVHSDSQTCTGSGHLADVTMCSLNPWYVAFEYLSFLQNCWIGKSNEVLSAKTLIPSRNRTSLTLLTLFHRPFIQQLTPHLFPCFPDPVTAFASAFAFHWHCQLRETNVYHSCPNIHAICQSRNS